VQGLGLVDRGRGVAREPRIDIDRDPTIHPVRALVERGEEVAGGPDVVGGHREDGVIDAGIRRREVGDLRGIRLTIGQCRLEDGGICRYADDALGLDEIGEIAGFQPLPG